MCAMKKLAAGLLATAAMAALPVVMAPTAQADICGGVGGRHVAVGGCTNVAGDVARGVAIASADTPYVWGEVPCYTVEGVPYYTPPGDPC
jgi:Ethanolamine utilization protein EutJ (predicted chaperonin)